MTVPQQPGPERDLYRCRLCRWRRPVTRRKDH